jgi:hypothetical protein
VPDRFSDDGQWYEGTSAFMLWAPKLFLAMALIMYIAHWSHWIQFSTAFLVVAFIHSRWLPWRFEIRDDGVELRFPFGRHMFLSRSIATVRVEIVGAFLYDDRRSRLSFGYPLLDGILYTPGRESVLRSAFVSRGYTITEK